MSDIPDPDIDGYRFHEQDWENFDQLRSEFEWEVPEQFNIATYVCDRWADHKNRVALIEQADGETTKYTFYELDQLSSQLANWFRNHGIEPGDRIATSGPQRIETAVTYLAAWKLGAVPVPVSVLIGTDGLRYRMNDCEPELFVIDQGSIDTYRAVSDDIPSIGTVLTMQDVESQAGEVEFWDEIDGYASDVETVETAAEDDAAIIYTSGTTGQPKGVVHAHRGLLGTLPCVVTGVFNMQTDPATVGRIVPEWSWAGSILDVMLPLWYYGLPIVAVPNRDFDPEREFELVEEFGISIVNAPATVFRMMMTQVDDPIERYDLASVRVFFSGGEAVGEDIMDWAAETFAGATVHEGYAQTEAPALITDCETLDAGHVPGYMGRPAPGNEMAILDLDADKPLEPGEVGEIAVRYDGNPQPFKEYWNKPDRTAAKVQNGWMRTEDLGRRNEDGYFAFHSRKDNVIISSGYRLSPEEIADALRNHEAVANAGVIGVPDDMRGEVPKAFVIPAAGYEASEDLRETLQQYVKDSLAKYEYPREIEFREDLPKTTTGKVQLADLRKEEGIE